MNSFSPRWPLLMLLLSTAGCASSTHPYGVRSNPRTPVATTEECAPNTIPLAGVVSSSATPSAPITKAVVVAIPEGETIAHAVAFSNARGAFRFCVEPGAYALTATATDGVAYQAPAAYGAPSSNLRLVVAPSESDLSGQITSPAGKLSDFESTFVRIVRASNFTGDIFYAPVDGEGRFRVALPAGYSYSIDAVGDWVSARASWNSDAAGVVQLIGSRKSDIDRMPSSVAVSQLTQRVSVFRTTVPEGSLEDMVPLKAIVGQSRIVGFGENSHGAREHFQLKHRAFRYLVTEMGFTVFAIEAGFSEMLGINQYVLGGKGDIRTLVAALGFWTWDTQEVIDLFEWMRSYNADPAHRHKLKAYGIDMQGVNEGARRIVAFLSAVDPQRGREAAAILASVTDGSYFRASPDEQKKTTDFLGSIVVLEGKGARTRAGNEDWEITKRVISTTTQALELYRDGANASDLRNRYMAENVAWLMRHEGTASRIFVWAHDSHISRAPFYTGRPMGAVLRQMLGSDYIAIGLFFGCGTIRAWDMSEKDRAQLSVLPIFVEPSPSGYLESVLASLRIPLFMFDLRSAASDKELGSWLSAIHPLRSVSEAYKDTRDATVVFSPSAAFDALMYVHLVSSSYPMPTALRGPHSR